jgi:bifunctional non-homologous end joining protein LigD
MLETRKVQRVWGNPKPQPRFIEPMDCKRVPKLPEGDDWVYEIKQDGYRVVALVDRSTGVLYSMSGLDYTRQFPHCLRSEEPETRQHRVRR